MATGVVTGRQFSNDLLQRLQLLFLLPPQPSTTHRRDVLSHQIQSATPGDGLPVVPFAQAQVRRRTAIVPQLRATGSGVRDDELEEARGGRPTAGTGGPTATVARPVITDVVVDVAPHHHPTRSTRSTHRLPAPPSLAAAPQLRDRVTGAAVAGPVCHAVWRRWTGRAGRGCHADRSDGSPFHVH